MLILEGGDQSIKFQEALREKLVKVRLFLAKKAQPHMGVLKYSG